MEFEVLENCSGFCPGVKRALRTAFDLRINYPHREIVILGQLVHNVQVSSQLKQRRIRTLDMEYDDLIRFMHLFQEEKTMYVYSAHGHFKDLEDEIDPTKSFLSDATCPFIKTINDELSTIKCDGKKIIYIGDKEHIEAIVSTRYLNSTNIQIVKTIDEINLNTIQQPIILINQSTYPIEDAIQKINESNFKYGLEIYNHFCPYLKLRIDNIIDTLHLYDVYFVVGSHNSSNANMIFNYLKSRNKETYLINRPDDYLDLDFRDERYIRKKAAIVSATSQDIDVCYTFRDILDDLW